MDNNPSAGPCAVNDVSPPPERDDVVPILPEFEPPIIEDILVVAPEVAPTQCEGTEELWGVGNPTDEEEGGTATNKKGNVDKNGIKYQMIIIVFSIHLDLVVGLSHDAVVFVVFSTWLSCFETKPEIKCIV